MIHGALLIYLQASKFEYTKVGVPIVTTVVGKRTFC